MSTWFDPLPTLRPLMSLYVRWCAAAGHAAPSHPTSASVLWRVYDVYPHAASRSFLFYYHGGDAPALVCPSLAHFLSLAHERAWPIALPTLLLRSSIAHSSHLAMVMPAVALPLTCAHVRA